jgi:hypothetical protein
MSSDRGTIPRGSASNADQQVTWSEPTAPGGRRVPSAPRERKPALAALAVILIIGGAAATGLLFVKSGQRVEAIEIVQPVGQGQQIPMSAMKEVQIASDSQVGFVSWSFASQVTQFFASTAIPTGTLLNSHMVERTNTLANGRDVIGLALKEGQLPVGLQVGESVGVFSTQTNTTGCPGGPGNVIAANAKVTAISVSSSNGVTDVQVALDPAEAGPVACNAANGTAAVGILPANGAG